MVNTDTYKQLLVSYFLVSVWVLNFVFVYFVFLFHLHIATDQFGWVQLDISQVENPCRGTRVVQGGAVQGEVVRWDVVQGPALVVVGKSEHSPHRVQLHGVHSEGLGGNLWVNSLQQALQSFCPFYLIIFISYFEFVVFNLPFQIPRFKRW